MKIRPGVEVAGQSDVGQRENNEDRYSYWEPEDEEQFRLKGRLLLVADGMGGYEGGQEASRIAIETVEEVYSEATGDPQAGLIEAVEQAHRRIKEQALAQSEFYGMGTTCTAVALRDDRIYYAHVGDSRLYLVHKGAIAKLTRDHSYVGRMVESGLISPEDAESHPQRHILTAALGAGDDVTPDFPPQPIPLGKGDTLILCTDGLWGLLSDAEVQSAVMDRTPAHACDALIQIAKQRGGADNITVQVLRTT